MIFRHVFASFALVLIVVITVTSVPETTKAQERLAIPGTSISIEPPQGFEVAESFSGLFEHTSGASVLVAEFEAEAFEETRASFASPSVATTGLARRGVAVDSVSDLQIRSDTVPLIRGHQTVGGVTYRKWMTVLGGTRTVVITVQAPIGSDLNDADVTAMLRSVFQSAAPTLAAQIEALPFQVSVAEPFRIVNVLGGSALLMTAGPKDVDPDGLQPALVIVMNSVSNVPDEKDRFQVAEAQLRATARMGDAEVQSRRSDTFADMPAIVLEGTYEGGDRRFIQYFGFGDDGSRIRLIALAPVGSFATVDGAIKDVAASVTFQ